MVEVRDLSHNGCFSAKDGKERCAIMRSVIKVTVVLLLLAAVAAGALWAIMPRQRSAICLWIAERSAEGGHDQTAAKLFEDALKIDPGNSQTRKSAVEFYKSRGNYTKVEYHLLGGIEAEPGNSLNYEELCRVYVEQGKLYDACALLDNIENAVAFKKLSSLRPKAPDILPESGNYRGSLSISITAPEGTSVYLSENGSFPTGSDLYTGELTPVPGDTHILAVCVDRNGLVSPLSSASYSFEPEVASVVFVDQGVEKIVRSLLSRPSGDISSGDLRTIHNFSNSIDGETVYIESVADLKWCSGLDTLVLTGVRNALDCLEYLPSLRVLSLTDCGITSLAKVSGLKELEFLDISQNAVSSVDALAELPKLERLIIRKNAVVNIAALGRLESLKQLDAGENAISDISPLRTCSNLESLAVDLNKITDISALSSLKKLTTLEISQNSISDIDPLRSCSALQSLSMSGNKIEILEPLKSCVDLTSLDAAKNIISDVTPLGSLFNLSVLNLSGNVIESVSALEGCVSLKFCNLSKNFISDISALSALQNLMELNVENNSITDLSKLVSCSALKTIYAFGNKVKDIDALEEAAITVYK